jgi:hypothetical protein
MMAGLSMKDYRSAFQATTIKAPTIEMCSMTT